MEEESRGLGYFPIEGVTNKEYRVIEERYNGSSIDTTIFYLKEEFEGKALIGDEYQQIIKRYKKVNINDSWVLDSLWKNARTSTHAFSIENNIRFVKLSFPLKVNGEWDKNDYNTFEEKVILLDDKDVSRDLNGVQYPKTVKVMFDDFTSLVNRDIQFEIYAEDIGLLRVYSEHLNHQPGKDTVGTRVEQILLSYEN